MCKLVKDVIEVDLDKARQFRPSIRHQDPRVYAPILKRMKERGLSSEQMLRALRARVLGEAHTVILDDSRFEELSCKQLCSMICCGSFMVAHSQIPNAHKHSTY
jgi:hypothetical protein